VEPATTENAIARALEDLLNTRLAIPDTLLSRHPVLQNSILSYGLQDFSALCIASEPDRHAICAAVQQTIQRHEPRLTKLQVELHAETSSINRLGFILQAQLRDTPDTTLVKFGGVLEPAAQHYTVSLVGG
jgi:type VI secretion system protein ImpF